jgi:hypothetical protein
MVTVHVTMSLAYAAVMTVQTRMTLAHDAGMTVQARQAENHPDVSPTSACIRGYPP